MVNTRFWNDGFISQLDPIEKLLFIYFITNEHTNICGIYELPLKIAAVETGIDPSMFEKILTRMKDKILYIDGWVCVKNFPKHQSADNPKIKIGIEREMMAIPSHIVKKAIAYGYPIYGASHSDSDSDSDLQKTIAKAHVSSEEEIEILPEDGEGNLLPQRKKSAPKSPNIMAIQKKFADLAFKAGKTRPIIDMKGYKMIQFALNTGGLTEPQLLDLFDEWFSMNKPDEEIIQITRALSSSQINSYKARNL